MGGMQRVSMQLLDELENHDGVEVIPVTLESTWKGIGLRTTLFLGKMMFHIKHLIDYFRPDIILFSSMVTGSLAYVLRNKLSTPMVSITHGQDVTYALSIYQRFLPNVFRQLDGVISVSNATRREVVKRGMPERQTVVIPNGFHPGETQPATSPDSTRSQLERSLDVSFGEQPTLLTVGRLVRRKGHEWFIREVLPRIDSDAQYMIIGDGPERENIQRAVFESGQQDKVLLLGKQSQTVLEQAYRAADLFVMPNIKVPGDMEGFGIVMLEANNAGTPVIASDLEGIADVIEPERNGFLIDPGDDRAFAEKIDQILYKNVNLPPEGIRQYVLNEFTWASVAEKYVHFLEQVVDAASRKQEVRHGQPAV